MKTTKKISKEVEVIDNIVCNKCGCSCLVPIGKHTDAKEWTGIIEATVRGGYSSPHLEDCTDYTFSLCEKCLVQLFKEFIIPVKETEYLLTEAGPIYQNCADGFFRR